MNAFFRILVGVLIIAGWVCPARADIDQLCLKQCVGAGTGASTCLSNCTYGEVQQQVPVLSEKSLDAHDVLGDPVPVGSQIILPRKPVTPETKKDYACFTGCLQTGNAYQLCEKRCTKSLCPAGSLSCSSVTGVLNGQPVTH